MTSVYVGAGSGSVSAGEPVMSVTTLGGVARSAHTGARVVVRCSECSGAVMYGDFPVSFGGFSSLVTGTGVSASASLMPLVP